MDGRDRPRLTRAQVVYKSVYFRAIARSKCSVSGRLMRSGCWIGAVRGVSLFELLAIE
jgi:hypothetical protein